MRTSATQPYADFTNDPFGNPVNGTVLVGGVSQSVPVISNPNLVGSSYDPAAAQNIYFQCNAGTGLPTAVNPDGSQAKGVPCAKIPAALVNNLGAALINLYPLPNANNAAQGFNFVSEPVRSLNETKFDIRVDHTFSNADNIFSRFSYDNAVSYVPGGGGTGSFAEQSAFGSNQGIINHARNIAIGETHVFSPTTVNQFSVGYNRIFDYITSQGTDSCASANLAGVGVPARTWAAPGPLAALPASRALTVAASFRPCLPAATGPWGIAATLRSKVAPISSPSLIPST